jgi:uncharacterized membrane protein (DUF485 family)
MSMMVEDTRGSNPRTADPPIGALLGQPAEVLAEATPPHLTAAGASDALHELSARRTRIASILTAVMMVAYFGFILLVAFDKPAVGTLLAGGRISLGILLGAAVILLAPILTTIYVRWANRHYDGALEALRHGSRR